MSTQTVVRQGASLSPLASAPPIDKDLAYQAAADYAREKIGASYELADGVQLYSQELGQDVWRFIVRHNGMSFGLLHVEAQTGKVVDLSDDDVRILHEKQQIYEARNTGELPLNDEGFIVGEYARRRATQYLDRNLSMHYSAAEPQFIPGESPLWQTVIIFRMVGIKSVTLGLLDVNAKTGEPLALSNQQIEKIRERTRAIVAHQTPTAEI